MVPEVPISIQKVIQMLVEQLKPEKVVLFGSRVRGDHRPNSDFDFCVIGGSTSPEIRSMIEDRNITVHTYRQAIAEKVLKDIKNHYIQLFQDLLLFLKNS